MENEKNTFQSLLLRHEREEESGIFLDINVVCEECKKYSLNAIMGNSLPFTMSHLTRDEKRNEARENGAN